MNNSSFRILLFMLSAMLMGFSQQVLAVSELALVCDDYTKPETCYLDDNGVPPVEIIGLISSILNANEGEGEGDDKCQTLENGELECALGTKQQKLKCSAFSGGSTLCNLSGLPEGLLALDCAVENGGGRCNLSSNPELVSELINDATPDGIASANLKSYIGAVFNCATRNAFDSLVSACDSLLSALANGEALDVLAFLSSTQPLNPEVAQQQSYSGLQVALNGITQRLFRLRQKGVSGDSDDDSSDSTNNDIQSMQSAIYYQGLWLKQGALLAQSASDTASDVSPTVDTVKTSASEYGQLGVFVDAGRVESERTAEFDLSSDTQGLFFTVGVDYRLSDALIAGAAFSYSDSSTDFSLGGKLESTSSTALLYGSYYQNNWFVDASMSLGGSDFESNRTISCALASSCAGLSGSQQLESNYYGNQYSLSVSGGYDFAVNALNITPYINYTLGVIKTDAYKERASDVNNPLSGFIVQIDEQSRDVGSLLAGVNAQYVFSTEAGVFIPLLSLQLVNELENEAQVITGRIIASGSGDFAFQSKEADDSYYLLGAGMSMQLKNGNAAFVNIQSLQAYEDVAQLRYTLGWRWEI